MNEALRLLAQGSLEASPALLGWTLLVHAPDGTAGGTIVETEAYRYDDPASHSCRGRTARNNSLFEEAGTIYVYRSYGLHAMLNLSSGQKGIGEGVLIRALEPTTGIELMQTRRRTVDTMLLAKGPARLTQALDITLDLDGSHLRDGRLELIPPQAPLPPSRVLATPRIGISKAVDAPWRFIIAGSPFVSGPKKLNAPPAN